MNLIFNNYRFLSIGKATVYLRCLHSSSISFKTTVSERISMHKIETKTVTHTQLIHKYRSVQKRIIHEFKHYYNGFKLLFFETKISFGFLRQIINGHTLTRKQRKQLNRTMNDLFRLVPFSVFIIVPFMEFTLPIFLKLFPNMLPSTFKHADQFEHIIKKHLKLQIEAAKLLQNTMLNFKDEIIHSIKIHHSIDDIIHFSTLFSDHLTIDKLNRSQLVSLCKLLRLPYFGPDSYLRMKLHLKFRQLKSDDRLIINEGIQILSIEELQIACHERNICSINIGMECLRLQLQQWLDLHLNKCIPTSILIFSHVYRLYKINEEQEIKKQVINIEPAYLHIDNDDIKVFGKDVSKDCLRMKHFPHVNNLISFKVNSNSFFHSNQCSRSPYKQQ